MQQAFEGLDPDDSSFKALNLILAAWDEGTECGVPPEQMAYAALFTALTDLVANFGEDAVMQFDPVIAEFVETGLIERPGEVIRLTSRGRLLSNEVFERFISGAGETARSSPVMEIPV